MRQPFYCALAAGLLLAACESPPERAGNTIDLYNDLTATYPNGATINVSYRFAFLKKTERSSDQDVPDHSFFFTEAGASRPHQYLQVRVAPPQNTPAPAEAARVWMGQRRYMVHADCLSAGTADMPPAMASFLTEMGDKAPAPGSELFVRAFHPQKPEPDGREIHVVFVQDLAPLGLTCAAIGDPARPAQETATAVKGIVADARRSFEIRG